MSKSENETNEDPSKEYWVQGEFPSEIREMWFTDWHSVIDYAKEFKSRGGLISNPVFINGIYDKVKNAYGNKRVSQTFFIKGKYYWADLNTFRDLETECMIFESNENGEVTNWSEVYCRRNIDVTRENLLKCIDEFKREM